jgi:cysteine desulfuration protein SufE
VEIEESIKECASRQEEVKRLFSTCANEEARYQKIIELGRGVKPLDGADKVPENIVPGCQSVMYMRTWREGKRVFFQAESEALISSGLAQILILVYSGLMPEAILKCPPSYLDELKISTSLSPNRANGLYSIHLKMKQEALKLLMQQ